MQLIDIFTLLVRLAELAFAAVVAGLNGEYLRATRATDSWLLGRQIYTEVIAVFAMVTALFFLIPLQAYAHILRWPADLVLSAAWFVAFGLLVDWVGDSCGNVFDWNTISFRGAASCSQVKATIAFSFLSALFWLTSAIMG
ncbi:uncharacterized protein C8A04DRAFT_36743 [Dichotomopilus funicola]|uniref:MARVEL domain-containing protein n=1 Tax=Dichotomopilus funicola TaxID=1934379 RepID=A0AAN6V3X2_9PEZI|nr:hypothetical protein C8A04DRAFT_36743 [Dichotomopilus funicola]